MNVLVVRPLAIVMIALTASVAVATSNSGSGVASSLTLASETTSSEAVRSGTFQAITRDELNHSFYFTRAAYGDSDYGFGGRGGSWTTDFPQADQWIVAVLSRLTGVDVYPRENPVRLDDPNLRRFPFIYAVEVARMNLREAEVEGLRNYLLAGGFLMVDDFWGTSQWRYFEQQIRRVLPDHEIVQIPMDHEIFSSFYRIEEIIQVPVVNSGITPGAPTFEQDGYVPYCLGIFDDDGRLMVVINWNTDLGDAWEHAEDPRYPLRYSTFAYQMAANFIVHAMTH